MTPAIASGNINTSLAPLVLGLVSVCCFSGLLHAADPPITRKQVERIVQPYLDAEMIDAVSIGVVQGSNHWTSHFGRLSADDPQLPNDATLYEIGSVSKVFTGVLLAEAVETRRVQLDQPIGTLMTQLQETNPAVGDSIQLRHLATHSSGLPRLPDNLRPAVPTNPYADYGRKQLTDFMLTVKPEHQPGPSSGYSNLAVGLLGDLLAAQAGVTYEQLLRQSVAGPLGMTDTTLDLSGDQRKRLAPPHRADHGADTSWDFDALAGAGAIRSTTADMIRWIKATLDPPAGDLGKAIELAWKEHQPAEGQNFALGLGWHIARDGQTRWHNGQTGGYHTMLMVNREINAGVIVMSNTASGEVDSIGETIIQTMAGMKVPPREFAESIKVDAKQVLRLQGRYEIVPGFVLTVRADGEKLFVQATNQPELRVYPESVAEWKYRVVDAQLTFDLPDQGQCKSVTLHQNGQHMLAPRIEP